MNQGIKNGCDADHFNLRLIKLTSKVDHLNKEEFLVFLKGKFFRSKFIIELLDFIGEEKYFGRVKEWIQKNCQDVPVPSRRNLTGNIQVLYKWIVKLSDGKYKVDVPGQYSERIYRVK